MSIITRLRALPSNTRMKTQINTREAYFSPYDRLVGRPEDRIFEGMTTYLMFDIDMDQFLRLVQEIDISSNNKFYTYTESDIPWLTWAYPNKVKYRQPQPGDILSVSIENTRYKCVLESSQESIDYKYYTIPVRLRILLNDISTKKQLEHAKST